jgi:hypothetical protein
MAPKKEKADKVSANAQEDMVLKYLKQQKYVLDLFQRVIAR